MTRDDIVSMVQEVIITNSNRNPLDFRLTTLEQIEHFAALVAAAEREKVARWMIGRGYATGHGDTIEDLLQELDWQIAENWNRALINGITTEREQCAAIAKDWDKDHPNTNYGGCIAVAIRARSES
jgi:hypothetical protein